MQSPPRAYNDYLGYDVVLAIYATKNDFLMIKEVKKKIKGEK